MKRLIDLTALEAKEHFLKGSSYFKDDLPSYISFEPILSDVAGVLADGAYSGFQAINPAVPARGVLNAAATPAADPAIR